MRTPPLPSLPPSSLSETHTHEVSGGRGPGAHDRRRQDDTDDLPRSLDPDEGTLASRGLQRRLHADFSRARRCDYHNIATVNRHLWTNSVGRDQSERKTSVTTHARYAGDA